MSERESLLLISDAPTARRLSDQLGGSFLRSCRNPYDGLLEMKRRPWPAVLFANPQPGFDGLCRASRRLQKQAKLLALCPPSFEPEVRPLVGNVLDDYFIDPLTPRDISVLQQAAGKTEMVSNSLEISLTVSELAALMQASNSLERMEAALAELVSRRCGARVVWKEAAAIPDQPPLLQNPQNGRLLVAEEGQAYRDHLGLWLEGLSAALPTMLAVARQGEAWHRLAITDHLTGAYNRRYFYQVTDQILEHSGKTGRRVALLLFDIDNFKRYNDTYGHACGDEILRECTRLIRRTTRQQDLVARIGGDEFVVLFWDNSEPRKPGSSLPQSAYVMSERFCKAVARHEFPSLGPEARGVLTISGGLATFPDDGKTCRQLLRSADKALMQAKKVGKNNIYLIGR